MEGEPGSPGEDGSPGAKGATVSLLLQVRFVAHCQRAAAWLRIMGWTETLM